MRTALALDAFQTGRAKGVLATATPAGSLRRARPLGVAAPAFASAAKASPIRAPLKPPIADSQAENSSAFIESALNPTPACLKPTANAISAQAYLARVRNNVIVISDIDDS
jgi:hypothetical protein